MDEPPLIFLCYRRKDSLESTTRLYEWLVAGLGPNSVYLDIVSSPPGISWRKNVQRQLPHAQMMIVIIGPSWVGSQLSNRRNPVRFELDLARRSKIPIIPVLVGEAEMPEDLPSSIAWLADLTAIQLHSHPLQRQTDLELLRSALSQLAGITITVPASTITPRQAELRASLLVVMRQHGEDTQRDLLQDHPFLDLDLHVQPHAIRTLSPRVVPADARQERPLGANETLVMLYDRRHSILVLGEPGAGKSTLLYGLEQALLARAEQDPTQQAPCPLYLKLASWAQDPQPPASLSNWLLQSLQREYPFPQKVAQAVLNEVPLALLLDGLDEVYDEVRPTAYQSCVKAINDYIVDHSGVVPIVVTCRDNVYFAQSSRLRMATALHVQPLTPEQITKYLSPSDEQSDTYRGLRDAISTNPVLSELAHTPLWLNLMAITYRDQPVPILLTPDTGDAANTQSDMQRHIFALYVERMLDPERRSNPQIRRRRSANATSLADSQQSPLYTREQARHWLIELSALLLRKKLYRLYLEAIQPDIAKRHKAVRIRSFIAFALIGGMGIGLFVWLSMGPILGILLSLASAFGVGMMGAIGPISVYDRFDFSWQAFRQDVATAVSWRSKQMRLIVAGGFGLGLLSGVFLAFFDHSYIGLPAMGLPAHIFWSLAIGLIAGLGAGLLYGFATGVGAGIVAGFGGETIFTPEHAPTYRRPGEGIRRTGRRGLLIGLATGSCAAIVVGVIYGLGGGPMSALGKGLASGLSAGLLCGLGVGLTMGLLFGLGDWLKHWLLRYELAREGLTPYHFVRFLRYATDRGLLIQVGNGFEFFHSSLLEYFASLDN